MFEQIIQAFCLGVASKGSGKGLRQGFKAGVESKRSEDRGNPIWQAALGLKKRKDNLWLQLQVLIKPGWGDPFTGLVLGQGFERGFGVRVQWIGRTSNLAGCSATSQKEDNLRLQMQFLSQS